MTSTSTRDLFRQSLAEAATRAKLSLPECSSRIDLAVTLVLRGDVDLQADGTALVGSQSTPTQKHLVNGMCDCRDFPQAPGGWCKHRTARALQLRTDRAMRTHLDAEASTTPQVTSGAAQLPTPTPEDDDPAWYLRAPSLDDIGAVGAIPPRPPRTVDAEKGRGASAPLQTSGEPDAPTALPDALKPHIVHLHGKPFVQYAGLLALAHERGLVSLKAAFISVTAELALAEAESTFADGKTFAECADATPSNVGPKVKAHFARMALTRAKARCLRDALNVGICTLEELTED